MDQSLKRRVLLIAAAAFFLRLLFIIIFPGPNYFAGISRGYMDVAGNVLRGKGVVTYVDVAPISSTSPQWSYEPFIDRPLGYLFLILLPHSVDPSAIGIQLLHAFLASCSVLLLFLVSRLMVPEKASLLSAGLYALWPLSGRFEIAPLPDAVMSFFLLAALYVLLKAMQLSKPGRLYLLAGFIWGIGMTMRPDILFLPLVFMVVLFFSRRDHNALKVAALILVGVLLILVPHTLRNYAATGGRIVPLGLGNGISMWEGISQFGDTLGTVYGDERMSRLEGYQTWAYPDGINRDQRRFKEALQIIADHPAWYAGVMLRRMPVLLTPDWIMTRKFTPSLKEHLDESPANSVWAYLKQFPVASLIRGGLIFLQYGAMAFAVVGFWKARTNRLLWLPAVIVFYYVVIHIPTNTEARYFYPAIPFLLLLAGHGWMVLRSSNKQAA